MWGCSITRRSCGSGDRIMIHIENATRKELLQIALHENCDIDYKYAAIRELQRRQKREYKMRITK
jgi:hypothetical protein